MNYDTMNILPLFSSPVFVSDIEENLDALEELKEKSKFEPTHSSLGNGYAYNSYISVSRNVLEDYPKETEIIMSYFNSYKNDVLKYYSTQFRITTSWMTKIEHQGFSQFHCHRNSYFSGILYLDGDEKTGPLILNSNFGKNLNTIDIEEPFESNLFNSTTWSLLPKKNTMIIFPSYLYHKIGYHSSENERYSIAFNLFPDGEFGAGDSYLNISHNIM